MQYGNAFDAWSWAATWGFACVLALHSQNARASSSPVFGELQTLSVVGGPTSAETGDFDDDGIDEMVVTSLVDDEAVILRLDANGVVQVLERIPTTNAAWDAKAADFNSDGDLDLVIAMGAASGSGSLIGFLPGNGDGTFGQMTHTPTTGSAVDIAVGDFNADGFPDVAAVDVVSSVTVHLGDGAGGFETLTPFETRERPHRLYAARLDQDSSDDLILIALGPFPANPSAHIYLSRGDGTFSGGEYFDDGSSPRSAVASDLDADGDMDLIIPDRFDALTLQVFPNDGTGVFVSPNEVPFVAGQILSAISADFDLDGNADFVGLSSSFRVLWLGLGLGNGEFETPSQHDIGDRPTRGAAGDLDGDGDLDIVVASQNESTISVLINQTVVPPTACSEADLAEPVGTLDFDDVLAFLTAFGAMDAAADLAEPSGVFDFFDVVAYLSAFGAGCP